MQLTHSTFGAIKIGIIVLLVLGVVGFLFWSPDVRLFDSGPTKVKAQFSQLQTAAEIHKARMTDYIQVCSEILPPEGVRCDDNKNAYALEAKLENGDYYCADSTGYSGTSFVSKGGNTVCPHEN